MKIEILKLLKERDGYLSGQELCDKLHVSRTAIWKVMEQLREEGYEIEAIRNRGYRLTAVPDVMTEAELRSQMESNWAGMTLEYHDEIDSTNTGAKARAEAGCPHGYLIVADHQSAGKGRRGRTWNSPRGTAIHMSMVLRPEIEPSAASMITLVAALAVSAAINYVTGLNSMIKWPNDIIVDSKKVCGILTEMSSDIDSIHYVVVGIGINVNTAEFPEEIRETATSLCLERGEAVNRGAVIAKVWNAFEIYYDQYLSTGDLSLLVEEYNKKLANRGRGVRVLALSGDYCGVALGINRTGKLLVEMPDKTIREVTSGEVSVRGIYGYV